MLVHGKLPQIPSGSSLWEVLPALLQYERPSKEYLDREFPLVSPMNWDCIKSPTNVNDIRLTWLGHSGLLVQMGNCNIVTDPVFNDRASPLSLVGPLRYRPPPCTLSELSQHVRIDVVLISHNHYDHLEHSTVSKLANDHSTVFVVPLGLGQWFESHVFQNKHSAWDRLVELDWHESIQLNLEPSEMLPVSITSLPARHWSNRTGDVDASLWCGYGVANGSSNFYFAGDTAWWDDVSVIGTRYGPFDVAAIPIGAYEPREFVRANHVNVEEAVALKDAIQATAAVPIHYGTFPLTIEPVMEPPEKLNHLMAKRQDRNSFVPWSIGETRAFPVKRSEKPPKR